MQMAQQKTRTVVNHSQNHSTFGMEGEKLTRYII